MLAQRLAQTLKAQADNTKGMPRLPYALEKALRVAPEAFADQTPSSLLATFEQRFPQAVDDVFARQVLAQVEAGRIPYLTIKDMQDVLIQVFGTESLDAHAKLFAPMFTKRITDTFGLYLDDVWANGIGDVWILQRPKPKHDEASLRQYVAGLEQRFLEGLNGRIDPTIWKAQIDGIQRAIDPVQKVLLADDLFRAISDFVCPLQARDVVESGLTFEGMINVGIVREYIRTGIGGWINGVAQGEPLHRFQTHTFAIPTDLQPIVATLDTLSEGAQKTFYESLNTELEMMLGVHASIKIDAANGALSVRLYLPFQPFQDTRPLQPVYGTLLSKLKAIKTIQEKTAKELRLADLENLLTDQEKAAVDTAIEALTHTIASDDPTQGVPFNVEHKGRQRSVTTKDGLLVPLSLGRIFREVILLKTGLQCIGDALDNLIREVRPATDPRFAMTQAGKDLIAQQVAVLDAA